jgi:hypothetical protein
LIGVTSGNLQQRKVVLQPVVGGKSSFDLSGQPERVLPLGLHYLRLHCCPRLVLSHAYVTAIMLRWDEKTDHLPISIPAYGNQVLPDLKNKVRVFTRAT